MSDERCMKDSMRPMMILRNNQGDYFRVGFSKQSRSCVRDLQIKAQRLGLRGKNRRCRL